LDGGEDEGVERRPIDDESRDMSLSDGDEEMSEDVYSPEGPYVPSFGQSANRYPQVEEDFIDYALPFAIPSPPSERASEGPKYLASCNIGALTSGWHTSSALNVPSTPPPDVTIDAEPAHDVEVPAADKEVEELRKETVENGESVGAPLSAFDELQANLAVFDKGLKELKDRLDSSLNTRVDSVGDLPERVKEVEQRVSEFHDEIERNAEKWTEVDKYHQELAANLDIVKALASEMRALHQLMSKELASELQAFKDARAEFSNAAQRMQDETRRLEASRSLKRKRSGSLDELPDATQGHSIAIAEQMRPSKRHRIMSSVLRTTAAVAVGAVATWSALAFS